MKTFFIDKMEFWENHVAYTDLYIYIYIFKGNKVFETGKLSIKVYQKLENRYMYIPNKASIQDIRYKIKNFVLGMKCHVRINTEEINFLKIQTLFFPSNEKSRVQEKLLVQWFSQIFKQNQTCYY